MRFNLKVKVLPPKKLLTKAKVDSLCLEYLGYKSLLKICTVNIYSRPKAEIYCYDRVD